MERLSKFRKIMRLTEVHSTNEYLKNLLREEPLEEGAAVIADFQTQGRGQGGNSWFSSEGKNLLFSFVIYPHNIAAREQFLISQITSLAIKSTLDSYISHVRIKWPNDIYWKDKKIAGILIENNIQSTRIASTIIGVGLNVNQEMFPLDLPNPISMKQITGTEYDREYILNQFQHEFFELYHLLNNGEKSTIEDEYMSDLYRADDYYLFEDDAGKFKARIKRIMPSGQLVLETFDTQEERMYSFKEVAFIDE